MKGDGKKPLEWWSDGTSWYMLFVPSALVVAAFWLDCLLGDPRRLPHPVVWLGRGITVLERVLRTGGKKRSALWERTAGVLITGAVVFFSYYLCREIILLAGRLHPLGGYAAGLYFLFTSFSLKGLLEHIQAVEKPLGEGKLDEARRALSMLVSRDTAALPPEDISRGAMESLAENTADGVVAPLFYAFIGGPPLAIAYKAVNTLDSMLGYKTERYRYFGWASARLDDVVNYIPARLTALFFLVVFLLPRAQLGRLGSYWKKVSRESRKHPSPNSGYPEAAAAVMLDIRLGGQSTYGGEVSNRPLLNADGEAPTPFKLQLLQKMVVKASLASLFLGGLLLVCARWAFYY